MKASSSAFRFDDEPAIGAIETMRRRHTIEPSRSLAKTARAVLDLIG